MEEGSKPKQSVQGAVLKFAFLLLGVAAVMLLWGPVSEKVSELQRGIAEKGAGSPAATTVTPAPAEPAPEEPARKSSRRRVRAQPQPRKAGPTFPLADDIPDGMERSALLASFGRPSMITSAVEQGEPTETLVYLRASTRTQTVVRLVDGKVVDAATSAY